MNIMNKIIPEKIKKKFSEFKVNFELKKWIT